MNHKRTITLSNQAPVSITDEKWPLIAEGRYARSMRNGNLLPEYEYDSHAIRVRQHADGRALVYAILWGATVWTGTEGAKSGELLEPGEDIVAYIRKVGADCGLSEHAISACIADLPAVVLE